MSGKREYDSLRMSEFSGKHSNWEFSSNKFLARAGRMGYNIILIGDTLAREVPDKFTYLKYKEDVEQTKDSIGVAALEAAADASKRGTSAPNKKTGDGSEEKGDAPDGTPVPPDVPPLLVCEISANNFATD